MMPRDRDKDFSDPDFERVSDAYSHLPRNEPPELIDQAVLNRARRAVSGKTVRPWNFGWMHALSTAAILVLGIALFLQQREPVPQEPLRVAKPPSDNLRVVSGDSRTLQSSAKSEEKVAASREDPPVADPAPKQELRQAESAKSRNEVAKPRIPEASAGLSTEGAGLSAAAASLPAADTFTATPAAAEEEAPYQEQDEPGPPTEAEGPEEWLKRIMELKTQGREKDFSRELAAFREAWPDYPLPAELSD